jgi:hypothetical protein
MARRGVDRALGGGQWLLGELSLNGEGGYYAFSVCDRLGEYGRPGAGGVQNGQRLQSRVARRSGYQNASRGQDDVDHLVGELARPDPYDINLDDRDAATGLE